MVNSQQQTTHTTHISNNHPPSTTVTGAQSNLSYMNSCLQPTPPPTMVANAAAGGVDCCSGGKKTYYNSIQDLTNFYYLNEDSVQQMCGGNASVCPGGSGDGDGGGGVGGSDDLIDIIGEYKYELNNSNDLTSQSPITGMTAVMTNNSTPRFEMCSSLTKANLVHNSGTATSGSKIKLKDDLFSSHNQFNYHHLLGAHKLPNIEYFNYLESKNFGQSEGVNAESMIVNNVGSIDLLTRDCGYIRNNERITSKIPTKISNFNF